MKKFVTLFYGFEDIHFYKDVGMIPYEMKRIYGYDSYIALRESKLNEDLKVWKYLKKSSIKCRFKNEFWDTLLYLIKNSKKIDVLNLYHYKRRNLFYILLYKFINKSGKIYLKLDGNTLNRKNINIFEKYVLEMCDIISTEIYSNYIDLKNKLKLDKVIYFPNGAYVPKENISVNKENIICFSGRIGAKEKSVETLIEAYIKKYNDLGDWYLYLVGPTTKEFEMYLNEKIKHNNVLKKKIIVLGNIESRTKLFEIYKKCKVFCLPSLFESFGISAVEAMSQGCYLLLSNFESALELTNNESLGRIFETKNVDDLSKKLIEICKKDKYFFECKEEELREYYYKIFDYEINCRKIHEKLK